MMAGIPVANCPRSPLKGEGEVFDPPGVMFAYTIDSETHLLEQADSICTLSVSRSVSGAELHRAAHCS